MTKARKRRKKEISKELVVHCRQYRLRRRSSDKVWPLRCADGRTFAERKADRFKEITMGMKP